MTQEDKEIFPFDVNKIVWMDYFHLYLRGLRRYISGETEDNLKEAIAQYNRRKIYHNLLLCALYFTLGAAAYFLFKFIFKLDFVSELF